MSVKQMAGPVEVNYCRLCQEAKVKAAGQVCAECNRAADDRVQVISGKRFPVAMK